MKENEKKKIAIVDDDASARKALMRMIASAGYEVFSFSSSQEFLSSPECALVSCVVADLRMPDIDGLGLQRALLERLPHVSLVFVTGDGDVPATVTAIKAGAVDFLEKPLKRDVLLKAISSAFQRCEGLLAAHAASHNLLINYEKLTAREREVLSLVSAGLLNKQIAAQLGVVEKTVKQHRGQVMHKMKADSLADLVMMAESLGVRPHGQDFASAKGRLLSLERARNRTSVG